MKKIAVLGWFGHNNFGDELFLEGYKQLFTDWTIVPFTNKEPIDYDSVNNCDLFALGGGELINSDRLFIPYPWVHKVTIPKIILGCGVNVEKLKDIKPNVLRELESFSYIGVRDYTALNILKTYPKLSEKTGLFYDLALQLNHNLLGWREPKDLAVVVPTDRFSNQADHGIKIYDVAKKSRGWLKESLENHAETVFIPFGREDNDDYKTCLQLASCSEHSKVLSYNEVSLQNVLKLFSEATKIYAYRLHGLILAFMVGVCCEFYPYHWKLKRVHDTLVGKSPYVIRRAQGEYLENVLEGLGF